MNPRIIKVNFSNPRIDESPYNEDLYGPKILEGVIIHFDDIFGTFGVRVKNIDYDVQPTLDPNFQFVKNQKKKSLKKV